MDLKEHKALGEQADTHWYYVSKARMITRHFPHQLHQILDVGAGLGWFSKWLLRNGYGTTAVCVDPGYDSESTETLTNGSSIQYVRSITKSDADLVLLMDVLEHVDDDVALLKEYWDKAASGTVFILTVPAFEFLWSAHDDYLEHRRRYTTKRLAETIRAAGAEPQQLHYFFGGIFPAAAAVRMLKRSSTPDRSDMGAVPALLNGTLKGLCRLESTIMKFNGVAGLSVVAQLVKP
ncbi:MAG: methyltransferase domain-containing protein [Boseongicola sp.]|nr:MAG: methyltransferase domain-containing protein [Boseongicola sp.]